MSCLRWAITFELIGFVLASVSIFLRIGIIKVIADKSKAQIGKVDNFFKTLTISKFIRDIDARLDSYVPTRRRGMIIRPIIAFLIDFPKYTYALVRFKIKLSKLDRLKKKHPGVEFVLDTTKGDIDEETTRGIFEEMKWLFRRRALIMSLTVLVFWPTIVVVMPLLKLLITCLNAIEWVTTKLTKANMLTNLSIFAGTLLIILGLALELHFTP